MTFSMVIWGLWSQDRLYHFLKSLAEVKNRDSLALPLVEFRLRHWVEIYSDTVFSWVTWVGRIQGSYTRDQPLSLSLLCPSIQLQTWTQVWIQERFAWSGYGFFLLLISCLIFVSGGTSSNKQQWFVKWIHSYNHCLNQNRDGICPSPQKSSLFPSAAKLQPPPRPGKCPYNLDIFSSLPTLLSPFLVIVVFSPCRNAGNCKSHTFLDHHLISLFFSSVLIWQNKKFATLGLYLLLIYEIKISIFITVKWFA